MTQQERSLDLSIQSSASSSSKATLHEERVYSDKPPLASSLLENGNVDGSEQGQQLLAEPLTDGLADLLPNFDLSFLAEFGQRTSVQDEDNIFNLTFSPFPFFCTTSPSTHPEPFHPAAASTPSPASCHFETDSNATPTSLAGTTLISPTFTSHHPSAQTCLCLSAIVFAIEQFEASCNPGNRAELDSIAAYQKEAIKRCRSMLACSSCMAKRENLVLLVFVTERIVAACGRTVVLYRTKDSDSDARVPSSLLGRFVPTDRHQRRLSVEDRDRDLPPSASSSGGSLMPARTSSSSNWRELLPGDYEISSPLEWEHLVRVVISLQLRAVRGLVADMEDMGNRVLGQTQTASLARAEIRVAQLEKDIYLM